jgi:uncharacterized membrane protein HdeD (DUF308 family)
MRESLGRGWRLLEARGLLALGLGLSVLLQPGQTLSGLLFLLGAYLIASGTLTLGLRLGQDGGRSWLPTAEGALTTTIGLITWAWPAAAATALLAWIAAWAAFSGLMEILQALRLRRETARAALLLLLAGLCTVAFGAFVAASPLTASAAVIWLLAGYGLAFGALLSALGLEARRLFNLETMRLSATGVTPR